jgi:DNA-binding transcriptional MerR regulator
MERAKPSSTRYPTESQTERQAGGPKQAWVWSILRRLRIIGLADSFHEHLLLAFETQAKHILQLQVDLRSREREMDITEVVRRSGVPASTLRFYEEKGLIASIGRRGLRRLFDPGVLERLALIAVGRVAGFSLDEIALMFAPDGRSRIDRQMLLAKAEELDMTISKLTDMRDGLRHAAACRAQAIWNVPRSAASCGPPRLVRLDPE